MNELITQLGVGGIFAVLVIRSYIELTKAMKNGKAGKEVNSVPPQLYRDIKNVTDDTNDKIKGLYSMHSKTDSDGLPVWYFPRSIVKAQERIASSVEQTTVHLKSLADSIEKLESKQRR